MLVSEGLRKPRVRTGCLTCRKRKKKCDEARLAETGGGCLRCKTAGFLCLGFPEVKSAGSPSRRSQSDGRAATVSTVMEAATTGKNGSGSGGCSATGDCLLSGHDLCDGCLATIAPVSMPAPMPTTPIPTATTTATATATETPLPQPLLQAIVGYYSTVVVCWIEGSHPSELSASPLFDGLVRRLTIEVEVNAPLRLSMAAVAACYTQSDQLHWPRDVDAVSYWTDTLKEASRSRMDRHLSLHASHLRQMASQAVEEASCSLPLGPPFLPTLSQSSDEVDLGQARAMDPLLIARLNLAIFAWADVSIEAYHQQLDEAILLVARRGLGRIADLSKLHSLETMGLRTLIWADICASLSRSARPYFRLRCGRPSEATDAFYPAEPFSCPDELLCCLCDVVLLRADARDIGPTPSPRIREAASRLEARLDVCPSRGRAPGCAEMMRQAAKALLYTDVLRLGPLERRCRACLAAILDQWLSSGARDFCRAVGCGSFLFSIFIGASIAVDERDRLAFREALSIVGHSEAAAKGARTVIERVWARTDETGFPVRWTDVLGDDCHVAFF